MRGPPISMLDFRRNSRCRYGDQRKADFHFLALVRARRLTKPTGALSVIVRHGLPLPEKPSRQYFPDRVDIEIDIASVSWPFCGHQRNIDPTIIVAVA
jgi:hypothetical protein